MANEDFYHKCADILGVDYICEPFTHYKRTRWNNRKPGSGRYPGYGLIRVFGNKVHVALTKPVLHTKVYDSCEEVLEFLDTLKGL